jgi:hypothetical protein
VAPQPGVPVQLYGGGWAAARVAANPSPNPNPNPNPNPSQACQCNCTVVGGGKAMTVNRNRVFPLGLSHVRGLCGPHGRRLDVTYATHRELPRTLD